MRSRRSFRFVLWLALGSLLVNGLSPAAARAESEALRQAGDILQIAIPITALGTTFFVGNPEGGRWDKQGSKQFLLSYGSTLATTFVLKQLVEKRRPSGSATTSYPSGHMAAAWSGAAFIGTRYGGVWGWLAYGGALVAGYSRIDSDWHYVGDVVAGASFAQIWNWVFVTPHHTRLPEPGALSPAARWHFAYTTAPAYLVGNSFTVSGGNLNLDGFAKEGDPTVTTEASLGYRAGPRHEVLALVLPFDSRDQGVLADTLTYGGATFPAGATVNSRWELLDLRLRWRYSLLNSSSWDARLGAGISYQNTSLELKDDDTEVIAEQTVSSWLPYAHAEVAWRFSSRWSLAARGSGGALDTDWLLDTGGGLGYRLSPKWDFAAGYRYYVRNTETEEMQTRAEYRMPYLEIGYTW